MGGALRDDREAFLRALEDGLLQREKLLQERERILLEREQSLLLRELLDSLAECCAHE